MIFKLFGLQTLIAIVMKNKLYKFNGIIDNHDNVADVDEGYCTPYPISKRMRYIYTRPF